ncbi:MAG: GxxExxY protein [Bacteroidetes bacterium]|nr:GxxExxY protein [Bacteroidota bacterium]
MRVHRILGAGFLESVYQEALEKEFKSQEIPFIRHQKLELVYDGDPMKKYFVADFVCFSTIMVELKSLPFIHKDNIAQLINYLKSTKLEVGLLVNFGAPSLQYKRCINTTPSSHPNP